MKKLMSKFLVMILSVLVGCVSNVPPAVGHWDIKMNTPLGELSSRLTINADGSGRMATQGLGEGPLSGITFAGNTMNFEVEVDAQGQTMLLDFNGAVDGDSIEGAFSSDFGDFAVTGTRHN